MKQRNATTRAILGLSGTLVLVALVVGAMRFSSLPFIQDGYVLQATFAEAGGLEAGDPVIVSGATVGKVDSIDLDRGVVKVALRVKDKDVRLGSTTTADIVTTTLLGQAGVKLRPRGQGSLADGDVIPVKRTGSPYDITSALSDLTTESSQIDVEQLSRSLTTLSGTFQDTPDDVKKALAGVDSISRAVNENDRALQQLLDRAGRVSGVLAERDQQVSTLLQSGQSLLEQLNARQAVVTNLLSDATRLSVQLTAVSRENEKVLGPALTQLNQVIKVLNENKTNLQKTIVGARNYATGFGEAVSSGPFFDAYVQNLTSPGTLVPLLSGLLQ